MLSLFVGLLEQVCIKRGDIFGDVEPSYGSCARFLPNLRFYFYEVLYYEKFGKFSKLYSFFWVVSRRLNFMYRRFGTLCLFHLHSRYKQKE
jgi:hypothetical protein